MSQINNTEVIKRILDDAHIQTSVDEIPKELGKTIVPVLISNPERVCNIVRGVHQANTGSQTIYTTPTDKDFYLVAANLNTSNLPVGAYGTASMDVVIDGDTQELLRITTNVGTNEARDVTSNNNYPVPIKIDRGTAIITTQTNQAVFFVGANIVGYTVDTLKK